MILFSRLHQIVSNARQRFLVFARARKKWINPSRAKIVIFDSMQADLLIPLFKGEHYEIIYMATEEVYLTPSIVFSTIRHFLSKRDMLTAYMISVLESIKPSIVVTFIDNSGIFQKTAQHYKTARFLAIQNGARFLPRDNPLGSPVIFHSEFACFGRHEVDQYTTHGAIVEKFYPIGSLKDSYHRARRQAGTMERRYDLCLVSQIKPQHYKFYPKTMESLDLLSRHLKVFCERHGKTLCVASRRHPDGNRAIFEWETEWFRDRLGEFAQIIPNEPEEYTSYALIDSSRVSLAMHTTLLREGFGRRNRILSCNFTGNRLYDFPVEGPWSLNNTEFEAFEARLLWLLNMTDQEYNSHCGAMPEYIIGYNEKAPTHIVLEDLISEAVSGVPRSSFCGIAEVV